MTLRSVLSPSASVRRAGLRRWAAGLAATLALTACATTGGGAGDQSAAAGDEQTLTIATSFAIDDLDPLENAFWGPEFGYVELLMRPERDDSPTPWVLEELTSTDDTTWTLTLREGVAFASGRALDADALAQLLRWTAENNTGFAGASAFRSAEATGDLEVTLTTTAPVPTLPNVLADESMVPVFDVDAYEEYLTAGDAPSALIDAGLYTGPYVVESLDGQSAELTPFPGHWSGGPALDALTIRFVPEATSRVQAVQTGEADLALYMPTAIARTLEGREDALWVTGEPTGSTFSLTLNNRTPGLDDARVRQAINAAVDYRALAEDVLSGQADVATSVFSPTLPYAVDTQETDLDRARQLLDEAGWTEGDDGVRTRDGQPLRLRLLSYPQQPDSTIIAEALQTQLGEVGVAVEVRQVDDITAEREGGNWDGAIVGSSLLSFGGSPVEGLADTFVTGAEENYPGISDPQLDALIAELGATFDEDQRIALLEEIQQVIADQGYWAATVARRPGVVTNETWRGYETPISNLWVTTDTAPGE
ncbi:ABC transporter substrate-binding protein [Modestobacter sp. VKM Ac-2979]|uniref:ABC transporter substrate-binding protein n=1 Tax=unclassified Modestobacter TaxID=2643866 RepID=UPI0022AB6F38|nr:MULTISPECIES: ABC transporter substrate-binding protein [unclassified Modestobacter]MCZ2812008.1 ABC transporter substrate-binding protein [Modestobacter sp. VKM Ac-2979]MCZ2843732.1 ABC transporter substrate-binding protein [Modestobacter sp. VKM Ac-2980]